VQPTLTMMWRTALAAGLVLAGTVAEDPVARIAAEFTRLRVESTQVLPAADAPAITTRIDRGEAALKAGRVYLAMYELQPAFEAVGGYTLAKTEKSYSTHTSFERQWKAMGAPPAPPASRVAPAFVEALAQAAEGRAPATYRASLPYAEDAQLSAGLYYLGESHAMVKFAAFCRSLSLETPAVRPLSVPSIEPHLARYETEVVKAYDAAAGSVRPRYPGVHVAIKISRSLDEHGRHEGALLQYLVSRYRFAVIKTLDSPQPVADSIGERIRTFSIPAGTDHSIARFFLEFAAATSQGPDPGPRGAAALHDDVLPAYFEAIRKP
jgi:hypothetical protein